MRKTLFAAASVATILCAGCAQPSMAADPPARTNIEPSSETAATLCEPDEVVIFSCRVRGKDKVASLCGANDFGKNRDAHAYYVFGTPAKIELRFPEHPTPPSQVFQRTHLVYAGPTGAFAYSFARAGVEYVLYSIAGTGFTRHGVMAYRQGPDGRSTGNRPLADVECAAETVIEAHGKAFEATLTWPENPELGRHGLPF